MDSFDRSCGVKTKPFVFHLGFPEPTAWVGTLRLLSWGWNLVHVWETKESMRYIAQKNWFRLKRLIVWHTVRSLRKMWGITWGHSAWFCLSSCWTLCFVDRKGRNENFRWWSATFTTPALASRHISSVTVSNLYICCSWHTASRLVPKMSISSGIPSRSSSRDSLLCWTKM